MKKLGELKIGDTVYFVSSDGCYITSVESYTIIDLTEIKENGIVIYYGDDKCTMFIDDENKNEYMCTTFTQKSICSDKEYLIYILENEIEMFKNEHKSIISQIS